MTTKTKTWKVIKSIASAACYKWAMASFPMQIMFDLFSHRFYAFFKGDRASLFEMGKACIFRIKHFTAVGIIRHGMGPIPDRFLLKLLCDLFSIKGNQY